MRVAIFCKSCSKFRMKKLRLLIAILAVSCLFACSSEESKDFTVEDAQRAYNNLKGTYVGNMIIDNLPTPVYINIGTEFKIRNLPLRPLLKKIFDDDAEITEALAATRNIVYNAPTLSMVVSGRQLILTMEPTDLVFNVEIKGEEYNIAALMSATVLYDMGYDTITINMTVDELRCNGISYNLTQEKIDYFLDMAKRQE